MRRAGISVLRASRTISRASYQTAALQNLTASKHGNLPGSPASPLTTRLHFFNSVLDNQQIPTFRILDGAGQVIEGAEVPELDRDSARKLYEVMMMLPALDNVLYNSQRQGKISFYMTSHGEEASIVGSAAALEPTDEVLGQYREMGVLVWRGFKLDNIMAQCFGNELDAATKGRQMPVHFSSPELHFHTISSPLATQIPQAAGVAYALKRDPERRGKSCAICYFGEGAASEGDFHAGLGIASTLGGPLIYFCRNNGFAISTPAAEQYSGDGIASRGPGYGMDTIRVDGNDALAVYAAVKEARRRAVEGSKAVLVEAMSYRVGHHSTSDDSFAYRAKQEVEDWKKIDNPHHRLRKYLESKGWWTAEDEETTRSTQKKAILAAFQGAEKLPKPSLENLFEDVYDTLPWNLVEQRDELKKLLGKYGEIWEPWRTERAKFKNAGNEFPGADESPKVSPIMRLIAALPILGVLIAAPAATRPILPANFRAVDGTAPDDHPVCDGCTPANNSGLDPTHAAEGLLAAGAVAGTTAIGLTAIRNNGLNGGFVDDFKRGDLRTIFSLKKPHDVMLREQESRANAAAAAARNAEWTLHNLPIDY
ncbi:hypothetical protein FRB98_005600 [Tulasnella sp. 332]|nr:hypothetical protein FRB98_005600 [Tulasnella sp. 332]